MSTITKIEWADRSWSPILGCDRVSDGCANCYAIRTVHRLAHNPNPKVGPLYAGLTHETGRVSAWRSGLDWTGKVSTIRGRLQDPLSWRKPEKVFVNSQSDLFHKDVPAEFIAQVFAVMAVTPHHTYQVLTKRHARMRWLMNDPTFEQAVYRAVDALVADDTVSDTAGFRAICNAYEGIRYRFPWPLPNLWLGVSVEDQWWADIRIPALLETPAAVRWISAEPLLGPLELLDPYLIPGRGCPCEAGARECAPTLDWVVVGSESGPGARPMDIEWAERIVRNCQAAGTSVLVKQLQTGPRGRATQDIATFPEHLRVREYPREVARG